MRYLSHLLVILIAIAWPSQQALAQSILRDAETEALLNDMAEPLVEASGLTPGNVDMVLINDQSINAFVAGGQAVYMHSGLLNAADSALEVQGVIAHEIGHITGGHIVRFNEGTSAASNISLLSLLLGVGAALAGATEAGIGIVQAGQRAALGKFLAFNRVQESAADAAGAEFLSYAGISGRGSLAFFAKLRSQEFRYGRSQDDDSAFTRTHPLSGDRIATLRETYIADPAWDKPVDPELQARFMRVKAKLYGYLSTPRQTLNKYPLSDTSVAARYARAYAYHKDALVSEALAEAEGLIQIDPLDPYFLELQGQILLESGMPEQAIPALRKATELSGNEPLIASMFGHALIATEDPEQFAEAEQVLRTAVARDRFNPFAWYQLGVVYAAKGDEPRARLASAEQQVMRRRYPDAIRSAQVAEAGLEPGTPDWIRAQDIGLQARAALEQIRDSQ
ncbi:MAG: M48 family metalloprotease [Erythrobacter sp.]